MHPGRDHLLCPPRQFEPGQLPGHLVTNFRRQIFDLGKGSEGSQTIFFTKANPSMNLKTSRRNRSSMIQPPCVS